MRHLLLALLLLHLPHRVDALRTVPTRLPQMRVPTSFRSSLPVQPVVGARVAPPRMSLSATLMANPILRDGAVALTLALLAKIWVALWGYVAKTGLLKSTVTRKLIHTGTGPLFVMGWPFFSDSPTALIAACAVPVINLSRLWLAGRVGVKNADSDQLISSLSRTGDAKEVARGPFYYTLVLLAATALSFRALPGVVAVCQMAVGDGLADILGRRLGKTKWGFVPNKSVEGSLAFVIGAWGASMGMLTGCHVLGYTTLTASAAALPMLFISVTCAAIELFSAPLQNAIGGLADDNLTVPLAGALLTMLLLRG